jgi:hypothetical protein
MWLTETEEYKSKIQEKDQVILDMEREQESSN